MGIYDHLIGKLTGHRCPSCGACVWVNEAGNIWCSEVSCRQFKIENKKIQDLIWVSVPQDHYWRQNGVQIIEDAIEL